MVPVIIIAVVFTGLAAAIFWAAPRGHLAPISNALMSQSAGAKAGLYSLFAVTYVGFGIIIPIVFLIGNHDRAKTDVQGVKLTSAEVSGRQLFGEHCAVCHTLAAAAAVGKTGPNLDQPQYKVPVPVIENIISNGCIQDAAPGQASQYCPGHGTMPADTVSGDQATEVAQFVAAVAGHN